MSDKEKYELIERYLNGTLTEQERLAFEQALRQDAGLRDEVELHRSVESTLRGEKIHAFRKVLKSTDKKWQKTPPQKNAKVRRFDIRRALAAAATVLILVLAYVFLLPDGSSSPDKLFADNFDPYKMVLNDRAVSDDTTGLAAQLNQGVAAYREGDYSEAAQVFQALSTTSSNAVAFRFYAAISELALGNADRAIATLETILQEAPPLFIEQSRWYLALAYLQKGDTPNAIEQLEDIQTGNYQYAAAQQLLKELG